MHAIPKTQRKEGTKKGMQELCTYTVQQAGGWRSKNGAVKVTLTQNMYKCQAVLRLKGSIEAKMWGVSL